MPGATAPSTASQPDPQVRRASPGSPWSRCWPRAFSSGCAALTGVEAISNGVPAFRKPKSKNAATTLLLLGTIAVTMLIGVIVLANLTGLQLIDAGRSQLHCCNGQPVDVTRGDRHRPARRGGVRRLPARLLLRRRRDDVILFLAANTAFNGFPVLGSILARDGYLPRQLHTRGDRLAYSNGIVVLAVLAIVLIVAFEADVDRADPALRRRRVRLVHGQPDSACCGTGPGCCRPRPTRRRGAGCSAPG